MHELVFTFLFLLLCMMQLCDCLYAEHEVRKKSRVFLFYDFRDFKISLKSHLSYFVKKCDVSHTNVQTLREKQSIPVREKKRSITVETTWCGVSAFSLSLREFSPGPPVSSHVLWVTIQKFGDVLKKRLLVNESPEAGEVKENIPQKLNSCLRLKLSSNRRQSQLSLYFWFT